VFATLTTPAVRMSTVARPSPFDDEQADRAFLTVAESVIHEWELARHIAHHLIDDTAAGRDAEGLHAADGVTGRRPEIHRVELFTHHVKIAPM
jgi:hypothetical protein